jgi:hypothetical protein
MKVSSVAVLLSVTSASAFNVSYLNQLGGPSAPAKAAPAVQQQVVNSGPASYLDRLTGGPELVSAMQSAPAPVAPAAPAPVAPVAGAAPAAGDYLSALTSISRASGAGLTGYLDALPSVAAPTAGAGMTTYLDSMSGSAPAPVAPAAPAAAAAPVAYAAPVVAAAAPAAGVAAAAGDYLSTLRTAGAVSGAGLMTHLDTLTVNTNSGTGVALTGYLSALGTNAAVTTGAGLTGYLDALKTNSVVSGSSGASPSVTSFLENVYNQIMALPADGNKSVNGNKVSYTSTSGPYAMAFIKN